MTNFIAFRLTDNDFHHALRLSVDSLMKCNYTDISMNELKQCMVRFILAYIKTHSFYEYDRNNTYINANLSILEINSLDELDDSFEGYILDTQKNINFYHGY